MSATTAKITKGSWSVRLDCGCVVGERDGRFFEDRANCNMVEAVKHACDVFGPQFKNIVDDACGDPEWAA